MIQENQIKRTVLPNGIILITAENPTLPAISMNVVVNFGRRYESNEEAGLASLLADVLDEGTTKYTAQEIAQNFEEVGAHLSTFAGHAHSGLSLVALTEDFPRLLELSTNILLEANFPENKYEQWRDQHLAQIKSLQDDPQTVASEAFNDLVYGKHPSHRPRIGYTETVSNLKRKDLVEAYNQYFVPNNTIISAVGNFSTEKIVRQIELSFADWKPNNNLSLPLVPEISRQSQPLEKTISKDKEQLQIYIGHLGIKRKNPDFYPLLVMDTILGKSPGMTSRIPRILRDEQGLAYTTYASITSSAGIDPGTFTAYIGTSPQNKDKVLLSLKKEIERIINESVTIEELNIAKAYLTGSFVFKFETNAQMASFLIESEVFKLGFDYLEQYPKLISQVTIEDVARVSKEYLDSKNLTTVIVGPIN